MRIFSFGLNNFVYLYQHFYCTFLMGFFLKYNTLFLAFFILGVNVFLHLWLV